MDLKQINSFITVVETGSFSKAAQELFISQPAISSHIKQLESDIRATLIDRSKKGIVLTKDGKEFINFARSINNTFHDVRLHFHSRHLRSITIGASSVPTETLLADILVKYHRKHPSIKFRIEEDNSQDIIERVRKGDLTLGIVGKSIEARDLKFEKLTSDRVVLLAPNTPYYQKIKLHQLPVQEVITREPLLLKMEHSGTYQSTLAFLNSIGISLNDLNIVARVGDTQLIKKLMLSGMGISHLSNLSVVNELIDKSLISLYDQKLFSSRHFFMVYRKDLSLIDTIVDLMSEIRLACQ